MPMPTSPPSSAAGPSRTAYHFDSTCSSTPFEIRFSLRLLPASEKRPVAPSRRVHRRPCRVGYAKILDGHPIGQPPQGYTAPKRHFIETLGLFRGFRYVTF